MINVNLRINRKTYNISVKMQLSRKHQLSIKIIIGMYNERKTAILVSFDSEGIVLTSSIQTLRSESAIFVSFASVVC